MSCPLFSGPSPRRSPNPRGRFTVRFKASRASFFTLGPGSPRALARRPGSFLLPGGHPTAAWAHVARTVCRRAERRLLMLAPGSAGEQGVKLEAILAYMNRLSTYLYVLARFCNAAHGIHDTTWKG